MATKAGRVKFPGTTNPVNDGLGTGRLVKNSSGTIKREEKKEKGIWSNRRLGNE